MKNLSILIGIMLTLAVDSIFADTTSFTSTIPDNGVGFDDTVLLQGFNTSLGTLTGIQLLLAADGEVTILFSNSGTTDSSYTNASASTSLSLTGPAGLVIPAFNESATSANGAASPGFTKLPPAPFSTTKTANPTDLTDYMTNGTVAMNFIGSPIIASGATNASGGVLFFEGAGEAEGSLQVTYTYTPLVAGSTPEPATITLLGSGLLGLGFIARKLKKLA